MLGFVNFQFLIKLFKITALKCLKMDLLRIALKIKILYSVTIYKNESSYVVGFVIVHL